MGLDMVEFVMEIEEHFCVVITDDQAWRITTVGDLYAFLLAQDCRKASLPCPTSHAFYRLRRTLIGNLGIERSRVRPSTQLRDLVPGEAVAATWHRLSGVLSPLEVPDPDPNPPPRWPTVRSLRIALFLNAAWASLVFVLLLILNERLLLSAVVALGWWLEGSLLVVLLWRAFWSKDRSVPIPRVSDLVLQMAAQNAEPDPNRTTGRAPETVWTEMTAIISRTFGMPAHEIRPEYRFSSDLGA
jgi:hypothetical protein